MGVKFVFNAGYVIIPTADITTAKLVINSTISKPGARYMCCDIKTFYLVTPLLVYDYIKLPIDILPEEIILEYNLVNLAHNGYVYCEIWKGMYGLLMVGILANQQLVQIL